MRALATSLACVVSVHGSADAQVRGTATFKERVRLPADAVFEASLVDVTPGEQGAVLGRTRVERPGNPPIRFSIDYDESRVDPRHVYVVRARILAGSRQRFVANHSDLVLTWGNGRRVSLLLQPSNAPIAPEPGEVASRDLSRSELSHGEVARDEVSRSESARSESARGESTRSAASRGGASSSGSATFTGNLPCADCAAVRHQLELFPDGAYFLRRTYLGKGRDAFVDEIGRWTLSRDGSTLTLKGTGDTTRRIAIGKPDTLHVLGGSGKAPTARSNALALTDRTPALEPRLEMRGMFMYMADAGRFTECSTRQSWPVAKEGDNAALESAYLNARRRDGEEKLVKVVGRVAMRPRMEGDGRERTLVVERFLDIKPGERCAGGGTTNAALENTHWTLTSLGDRPVTVRTGQQLPYLMLNAETGRMSGWTGCTGVSGRYRVNDQSLAFTTLMSTRTTCASGAELERRYLAALRKVSRAKVTRQRLELFDARGKSLARFEAGRGND
ncbi:MAG TPA: META domain-containing protein [Gemmatimonadaceae bacterium]